MYVFQLRRTKKICQRFATQKRRDELVESREGGDVILAVSFGLQ